MRQSFLLFSLKISRFHELLKNEPIAKSKRSAIFTIPKEVKDKTRIKKLESKILKKEKRLEMIHQAKKKLLKNIRRFYKEKKRLKRK